MGHVPVMKKEVIHYLIWDYSGTYVDCTLGDGMHSKAILKEITPQGGTVIGIDRDSRAISTAKSNLKDYMESIKICKRRFSDLSSELPCGDKGTYHGFLFDLGLNSSRLREPSSGFSYLEDGPLDMRMSPEERITASQLVNSLPEKELADLLYKYSDERHSRKIARAIVRARQSEPIETTFRLRDIIFKVIKGPYRLKSVSRCFQALRISVNNEIEELVDGLSTAFRCMLNGGRLVVISYHSIEDRIVKNFIRDRRLTKNSEAGRFFKILTPKPVQPLSDEVDINPAARSAKLRAAELVVVNGD
ncbi:MAG: 16S rRNA (cytosine(1402)-N(4))-methyltransferase RsmH [candidate division Zixibacteria bacterium]|nr:16S rRNA (cytosine(1402)-N(4))-methyltransferase RsmH [candidate division Zixibacteria bacterium]